jgi:hypothetical protein
VLAFQRFDLHLHTEVRDDQPRLLGAQVAAFERLQGLGFALGGTRCALALDFFDAPVLAAIELAFGHVCSV